MVRVDGLLESVLLGRTLGIALVVSPPTHAVIVHEPLRLRVSRFTLKVVDFGVGHDEFVSGKLLSNVCCYYN
ncbi:MAG TPA: hypothetical protein HPP54_10480 [Nitrospinae bacterium]|nr:hypothetical protein [Nitrospinota bacterium]